MDNEGEIEHVAEALCRGELSCTEEASLCLCVCVMCELSVLFNGACFCRSGTDEEYKEKKKLLQDITDLKRDSDEHRRVLALAKKLKVMQRKDPQI